MPKWIETKTYRIYWEMSWKIRDSEKIRRMYEVEYTGPINMDDLLEQMRSNIEIGQYEIKSVMPVAEGYAKFEYDYGSSSTSGWGYGWGFGVSPTTSILFFLQRECEVTQEEYKRLLDSKILEEQLKPMKKQWSELGKLVENDRKISLKIEEKKGLLGGISYWLADKKFKTHEEAQSALHDLSGQIDSRSKDCSMLRSQIDNIQDKIRAARSCLPWIDLN